MDISLYIHIPFCASKCNYCDFSSFPRIEHLVPQYMDSLIAEMALYKEALRNYSIKTIFIGGGTPSHIGAEHIYRIMNYIHANYRTSGLSEITIEVNPGTVTKDKAKSYKDFGINRVSMGAQSFNDQMLKKLGRIHNSEEIYNSYRIIEGSGIENINLDLIFGLPNQKLNDAMESIRAAVALGVQHISHYGLIIEEATNFYSLLKAGKLALPGEDEEREMYHRARNFLIQNGYDHYEISNFSLEGYESKHNLAYWDIEPYLGLGLSSHSYMNNRRFFNSSSISNYIDLLGKGRLAIEEKEELDLDAEIEDYCIFGLRKIRGINKERFLHRFAIGIEELYADVIEKHVYNGLLIDDGQSIRLTEKGLDLSNLVEVDFLK